MKYIEKKVEQLTIPLMIREGGIDKKDKEKGIPAKRVDIDETRGRFSRFIQGSPARRNLYRAFLL